MQLFNVHGELLQTLQIHGLLGPDYPAVGGMLRPALHRILASAAGEQGVSVRTGTTVTGLEQHADRVDVELSDGAAESYVASAGSPRVRLRAGD